MCNGAVYIGRGIGYQWRENQAAAVINDSPWRRVVIKDVRFNRAICNGSNRVLYIVLLQRAIREGPATARVICNVSECLRRLELYVWATACSSYSVCTKPTWIRCVWQCSYTDSNSEINLGIKRLELKGTVFKWLWRTLGIRLVDCVEMFNDVRNTTYGISKGNRISHVSCKTGKWKNVLRRISHVRNGTWESVVSTFGQINDHKLFSHRILNHFHSGFASVHTTSNPFKHLFKPYNQCM
jgi:hypothetical protein